ncbi:MAG: hypothetical protein RR701_15980, partial [Comamonas sp.]
VVKRGVAHETNAGLPLARPGINIALVRIDCAKQHPSVDRESVMRYLFGSLIRNPHKPLQPLLIKITRIEAFLATATVRG